jgi:phosphocarrier protein
MTEKEFIVENKMGLHARPASLFVQTASKFKCDVKVRKDVGDEKVVVNGKSVMGLMMLAVACGEELTLLLDGPDEAEAAEAFKALFKRKFDEE